MSTCTPAEVFAIEHGEVAQLQLTWLRRRFAELSSEVRVVRDLAAELRIHEIAVLEDVVPLCLPHTVYKSYLVKHVENGRYDRLTAWLDALTSEDLSHVDVGGCDSLEDWLDTLETATNLRPMVSSGTTGKISFFPRSAIEAETFVRFTAQALSGFGDEPDSGLASGEPDWFSAVPLASGRQSFVRMIGLIRRYYYGGDASRIHTLGSAHWDADMLWLSGRMRAAQGRGEHLDATLTPNLERVRAAIRGAQSMAAEDADRFISELIDGHRGRPVILFGPTASLIGLATACRERGLQPDLHPRSFILTGGGTKGQAFPEGWEATLGSVFPPPYQQVYGMTESTATCRLCSAGWFHWPPTIITFVLDPETGEPLPRIGTHTGRLAIFDLCAQTYWGGAITGDQVTIDWDGDCPCGRLGPRVQNNVVRYSNLHTDDKITCAKSPDAYQRAVDQIEQL